MAQNGAYRRIGNKNFLLKPRSYVVDIVHTATASDTATGQIVIDSNSAFLLYDQMIEDTNDPSVAAPGLEGQYACFIQVQDTSNGYLWSNDFIGRAAFARDRMHGYRVPQECLIDANTRLNVTLKNPVAGSAIGTTKVTLQGFSLYEIGQ